MGKKSDKINSPSVSDKIRVAILSELEDGHELIVSELEEINFNTDPVNNVSVSADFIFSDGTNHDATVAAISNVINTPQNMGWNVIPVPVGMVGNSLYTVQISNDGSTWHDYAKVFTNVSYDNGVEDPHLTYDKMRIKHDIGSSTGGTVRYVLTQIN